MTAQKHNTIIYKEKEYSLSFYKGIHLSMEDFGLKYYRRSTDGSEFYNVFEVVDGKLKLQTIKSVDLDFLEQGKENYIPKKINNILPVFNDRYYDVNYYNLNLDIDFTGKLHLLTDFISALYVHSGFHRQWKYKKVIQLKFKKGKLIEEKDISKRMKRIREKEVLEDLYRLSLIGRTNEDYKNYYENHIKEVCSLEQQWRNNDHS